jgi:lysyl-tRNA synthetase class I
MKIFSAIGIFLFLIPLFLCQVQAVELCETQDFYNLANSSSCKVKYNQVKSENDPRESMFEILKNYPYENKGMFEKLLKNKIIRVQNYIVEQKNQKPSLEVKANINNLEQAEQSLNQQLEKVNSATVDNWENARNQASKVLKEVTKNLQEIK